MYRRHRNIFSEEWLQAYGDLWDITIEPVGHFYFSTVGGAGSGLEMNIIISHRMWTNKHQYHSIAEAAQTVDMRTKLTFIIALCVILAMAMETNASRKLRLCVVQQKSNIKRIANVCGKFSAEDPIECVFASDRLGCMRDLTASIVDFAVFEPEDLIVYSNAYSDSYILITHELRLLPNETASFGMIALVTRDIRSLSDLQGKKFCHPGFNSQSSEWTRVFANFFQSWITPKKCEPDSTLIQNELSSLSEFFHSACIAGPWVPDTDEDAILKSKYRNLHALCDNPNSRGADEIYYGREGAIRCLIDGVGDIAWVRLADAQQYFKTFHMKNSSYNYVCPDGLARPIDSHRPCIWISRPWPVIAAQKNNAEKVSKLVREANDKIQPWHKYLMEAMEVYHTSSVALDSLDTPEDYLHRFNGFSSANMRATCRPSRDIRWCIASPIEDRKCRWMRNAAIAYGIEPAVSCHQFHAHDACIEGVKNGHTELFIVKPEELTEAYDKNLTSLFHMMSKKTESLNTFGILVKNSSKIWSLRDIRDKRACFSKHRGIEWKAFIRVMRTQMISHNNEQMDPVWNCSDDEAMKHFFKEIIILGDSTKDNENGGKDPIESTYDCLISGKGDVAFVNLHHSNKTDFYKSKYKLRSICVDEIESKTVPECILTWTPLATVMVHVNMTELRRTEIQTMLSLLDESFGFKLHQATPLAFLLYGPFDHNDNVIFPMDTHYLQQEIRDTNQLPRNFLSILKQFQSPWNKLSICNTANSYVTMEITLISISIVILTNHIINS